VSLNGAIITITNPGPVKLKFSQTGSDIYMPAPVVDFTFCIDPVTPTIVLSSPSAGSILLTSSSETNNNWSLNGSTISGANAKTYSPTESGAFSVKVDFDGCFKTSSPMPVVITGLEENRVPFIFYPNPIIDFILINFPDGNEAVHTIYASDLMGRKRELTFEARDADVKVDARDLAPGGYVLLVETQTRIYKQIIIMK
jgi:hypothetical protein